MDSAAPFFLANASTHEWIRSRESSREPLSTTTTLAGGGSAANSASRHADVSSALFQLSTTTPNVEPCNVSTAATIAGLLRLYAAGFAGRIALPSEEWSGGDGLF